MQKHINSLIKSTSPYLQQHAHNPVMWQEWTQETLQQAVDQDKPILVSIGYSSCHWCHVMERESFEDESIASVMNEFFINIKVDREERPDIDQVYMDAVQAMGLQGGWPLNVFLTPDQKPFYGGTYFPNEGWKNLLNSVAEAFQNNREKLDESAEEFTQTLQRQETEKYKLTETEAYLSGEELDRMMEQLAHRFDNEWGGIQKSPKFPMPSVWQYLGAFGELKQNKKANKHFKFTLDSIANGGLYDHVGGGFCRYSTDGEWHVPHFEKMLYDNGQLLSLYANGLKATSSPFFKEVILQTCQWLKSEMLDESGGFYSALDADSEGVEGKFYVWDELELQHISKENYPIVAAYFDSSKNGNWEGVNVLRKLHADSDIAEKFSITQKDLARIIKAFKNEALAIRNQRIRPGLDNKIIAGWNGLTLSGLSESYTAVPDTDILALAKKNAAFIKAELISSGILKRFPNKPTEGYLEDYAAVIQGFIKYYETTFDSDYLALAAKLVNRANDMFFDAEEGFFYFTGKDAESLIARKKELFDNVIPASNSLMAWNLIHLGTHLYDDMLIEQGKKMLAKVSQLMQREPEYMSQWGLLAVELSQKFAEIVIIGSEAKEFALAIQSKFLPAKIIAASEHETDRAPFSGKKIIDGKTTIYVCYNKSCQKPVFSVEEALVQLT